MISLHEMEERHIERLEALIDEMTAATGALENFILPGGSVGAAYLHVARTVCRRAEREVATLAGEEGVGLCPGLSQSPVGRAICYGAL